MDELETLVKMVAALPTLTVWVLVGYLVYKVAIIGSIYGVIRLAIERLYGYLTRAPHPLPPLPVPPPVPLTFGGIVINKDVADALVHQVMRLPSTGGYIHAHDVTNLARLIDAHLAAKK